MNGISINTTQNVVLEYEPASVGERILATLLDLLVLGGWILLVVLMVELMDTDFSITISVLASLPLLLYHLVCEVFFNGQSIGKSTMHLKVIRLNGTQPSVGDYFLRWVLRLIDISLAWGSVAIFTILINGKGQRLGDIAAGTTVIRAKKKVELKDILYSSSNNKDYHVMYPAVLSLSDKDINTIRKVLRRSKHNRNQKVLVLLADKVKEITGIQNEAHPREFLITVLKDYAHLAAQSA